MHKVVEGKTGPMFDEAKLDSEILAAVRAVWVDEKRPVLLSQLGLVYLSDSAKEFVAEHAISLKRHVRLRLADEVRFVPMVRQGGGLAPIIGTEGLSDAELERAYNYAASSVPSRPRRMRFDRQVWRAFSEFFPEGYRRAIDPTVQPPTVRQLSIDEPLLRNELAVDAPETALSEAPDGSVTAAAVERAILTWCAEKGIEPSRLVASMPAKTDPKTGNPARAHAETPSQPTFIDVLRSIPRDQLSRVSVPGDVLLSIVERLVIR